MSTSKNRFTVIEIHKVPPHSSIKQFTAKLEALADARLARPTAQKNLLKYDIMVPNDRLDLELNARGFQESQPIILVQKEFETIDDCRELLRDEAIAKSVSTAHEFIGASSPVAISAADVVIRIDDSTKAQSNADMCMHVIVFEAAANESGQQLYERIKTDADRIVQLPIMQKHVAMHNMLIQNAALSNELSALGVPPAQPIFSLSSFKRLWII
ncbi:hypothetical protein C8R47DRAFT_1086348 [Mycena vitilis]|nr:hypothetical protein C8R47DRAFT_1086348 [Mycena vitilis]